MNSSTLSPKKTTPPSPVEQDKSFTSDPWFRQLYLAAFGNLHSQFEQYLDAGEGLSGQTFVYYEELDKESVARSKHFAAVAWNSACEAYNLFEAKEADAFNKKLAVKSK